MKKLVVIFVEGDTEVEFYKKLVWYYRTQNGDRLSCRVEYGNVKGVGNYQSRAVRIFNTETLKITGQSFFLCGDCPKPLIAGI